MLTTVQIEYKFNFKVDGCTELYIMSSRLDETQDDDCHGNQCKQHRLTKRAFELNTCEIKSN